jgi:ADP-L-glycero-D-manno-heptose 6-epimerase
MRVLLTGYKGFIGSHMLRALNNYDVSVYDWGDQYPSLKNIDWVIHIGGISSTTEKNVEKIMTQNYDFSVQLYEDCKLNGVNLQYSSSASVYGLNSDFKESSPVDPRTPYAWSKYLFERYVEKNPSDIISQGFRYFNVYGSGEEHKGNQASPFFQFQQQAKTNGLIKVFENSEDFCRDFVPVETIVSTHLKFLSINQSGIWNIGSGKTKSFKEIAELFNVPVQEIAMPEQLKLSYQKYTCADLTKLNESMGRKLHD